MTVANKAITRTRYSTPTVGNLLVKLKTSKIFTKLDVTSTFYQTEIDQDEIYDSFSVRHSHKSF